MQDQMIILMALAKWESHILAGPITLHTETAIHIATEFTDAKFSIVPVSPEDGGAKTNNVIQCQGVGYCNA